MNAPLARLSTITALLLISCACVGCGFQSRNVNNCATFTTNGMLDDFLLRDLGPPGARRENHRRLILGKGRDLNSLAHSLPRLRPTELEARECTSTNLDALKGITSLRVITLHSCPALQNLDGIRGLTALRWLYLEKCTSLNNVDGLEGLTGLKTLKIEGCPSLRDLDALAGLTGMKDLDVRDCRSLQNVDGIKGLTGLRSIAFIGCTKLSSAALREIRVAFPHAEIYFPDGRRKRGLD